MRERVAKLKKLRGMTLKELSVRSRQEMSKLGERFLNLSVGEMSDSAFTRALAPRHRKGTAAENAESVVERIRASIESGNSDDGTFFASLRQRDEIVRLIARRFPKTRQALIERARRAMDGRFDLLGYTDVRYGGEIDWRLEPISGTRTTLDHWSRINYLESTIAGDKKITWELNRHNHFVTLGQAYWVTGDERYASAFVSQARSWMDSNPPNRGINWSSSLEIAFRSIAWVWSLHLFCGSPHLTPDFSLRLLKHLIAHGRHIEAYLSHYFSPNTHLTGEALGLFYLGVALPELREAQGWRTVSTRILLEQLPLQVRGDGVYFEQASCYHRYTTDFYIHLSLLARSAGLELPNEVELKLAQLLDHLMWITRPDGSSPLLGDDDSGRLIALADRDYNDFRDTLAIGAALFGRGDWKWVAGEAPVELLWLLGPEGLGQYDETRSQPPRERSRGFEAAGCYVVRDGWGPDSTYALMDCGPHGSLACGHAHSDALAFEFAALGKTWLVDPGTFTYTADPHWRDQFRTTDAHNTVTVDDQPQSIPAGPFSWGHVAQTKVIDFSHNEDLAYLKGTHDGYERLADPVTHTRSVVFVRSGNEPQSESRLESYLMVRDTLTTRGRHRYVIRYHLSPSCTAVADGNRILVAEPKGRRLSIIAFGNTRPQARIGKSWVSRSYGHREPALVADFEVEASGTQEFTTFIIPSAKGQLAFVEDHLVGDSAARAFQITCGRTLDLALMSDGSDGAGHAPLAGSDPMAWCRFVHDRFVRTRLINGSRIEAGGGLLLRAIAMLQRCSFHRVPDPAESRMRSAETIRAALREAATGGLNQTTVSTARGSRTGAPANDGNVVRLTDAG